LFVLTYYIDNRKTKTHEQLIRLLVCDRIKFTLSRAALQHVLSLENKADDGCLKLSALLEALDLYYDTHLTSDKPRTLQSAISRVTGGTTEFRQIFPKQKLHMEPQKIFSRENSITNLLKINPVGASVMFVVLTITYLPIMVNLQAMAIRHRHNMQML